MASSRLLPLRIPRVDKIPSGCETPEEFQAGDILVFNVNHLHHQACCNPTTFGQKLFNNTGGHKDSVHVGFIVDVEGKKQLAHLRKFGFILEDVDKIKTTTHIYRPRVHQAELANELSKYIQSKKDELKKRLRWKTIVAVWSFVRRLFFALGIKKTQINANQSENYTNLPTQDKFISSWSLCSKFLTETYASSCNALSKEKSQDYRRELMNITSNTVPKTLQSYLYRCSNYDYFILPSINERNKLVPSLSKIIDREIIRLANRKTEDSQFKGYLLQAELTKFKQQSMLHSNKSDFDQAKELIKSVIPILKINTGHNVKTPSSYKHVMSYAKSQGLYSYYFENDLRFNKTDNDLTSQAKTCYNYNENKAYLYSEFRKLGFSDAEAQFECRPSLKSWMKVNYRRNIFAAVTVLPFLFWSIPYGLSQVSRAKTRNNLILAR